MSREVAAATGLTRRDALRLVGVAAGLGAAVAVEGYDDLLAWLQRGAASSTPLRFPRGAIIRTLLKDVSPETLGTGATLFHEHLSIGHTCCLDDPDVTIIREIAKRGAFVGFDRVTTVQNIMPDEKKVAMVLKFIEAGHADKLLLAADFTGQRTMEAGPGYGRTLTVFVPLLRKAGVNEETLHTILYDNPRRFLAFVPKKA